MGKDAAVGSVVNAFAIAIVTVAGIDATAGTVIGRAHIATVVFQAVVLKRVTTDGNGLIGRPRIAVG